MILGARFFFSEGIFPLGVEMTQCQANSALGSQGKKVKKIQVFPNKYHLLGTTITEYTEECSLCICINALNVIYTIFVLWDEYLFPLPSKLGCLCEGWLCSLHQHHQHLATMSPQRKN